MNRDQIQGKWKQLTGKAKAHWAKLTDEDLERINGEREALEGRLQELYGISREKARKEVDLFFSEEAGA